MVGVEVVVEEVEEEVGEKRETGRYFHRIGLGLRLTKSFEPGLGLFQQLDPFPKQSKLTPPPPFPNLFHF